MQANSIADHPVAGAWKPVSLQKRGASVPIQAGRCETGERLSVDLAALLHILPLPPAFHLILVCPRWVVVPTQ